MRSDRRLPEPALFSFAERLGISLAVMALLSIVLVCLSAAPDSPYEWLSFLKRAINALPAVVVRSSEALGPLFVILALGGYCFLHFRRHPLEAARGLWFLAAFTFLVWLMLLPRLGWIDVDSWTSALLTLGRPPTSFQEMLLKLTSGIACLPLLAGLFFVLLAGELSHVAHLRLAAERLAEFVDYSPLEYARAQRRERLILAIRGSSRGLFAAASHLLALIILPTGAAYWIITLHYEIRMHAVTAQPLMIASPADREPGRHLIVIDASGLVLLNGTAMPDDLRDSTFRSGLYDLMRAEASDYGPSASLTGGDPFKVGLLVAPETRLQRLVEVLQVLFETGVPDVALIDGPVP